MLEIARGFMHKPALAGGSFGPPLLFSRLVGADYIED
jgi:hypothetical protein